MEASTTYRLLTEAGIHLRTDGSTLTATPANMLSDELRTLIRANKPELIALLNDASKTSATLIEAAMLACDRYSDGDAARAQMCREVEATPPHLREDLLQHFRQVYGRAR